MLQAGRIVNVHLPKDRVTQNHQGYGFVEFVSEEDADYAAKIMNQTRVWGKPIRVNKASADKQKTLEVGAELFVGNLDPMVDEKVLFETFGRFGSLTSAPKVRLSSPYFCSAAHLIHLPPGRPRRQQPKQRLRLRLLHLLRSLRRRNRQHARPIPHEQRNHCPIRLQKRRERRAPRRRRRARPRRLRPPTRCRNRHPTHPTTTLHEWCALRARGYERRSQRCAWRHVRHESRARGRLQRRAPAAHAAETDADTAAATAGRSSATTIECQCWIWWPSAELWRTAGLWTAWWSAACRVWCATAWVRAAAGHGDAERICAATWYATEWVPGKEVRGWRMRLGIMGNLAYGGKVIFGF